MMKKTSYRPSSPLLMHRHQYCAMMTTTKSLLLVLMAIMSHPATAFVQQQQQQRHLSQPPVIHYNYHSPRSACYLVGCGGRRGDSASTSTSAVIAQMVANAGNSGDNYDSMIPDGESNDKSEIKEMNRRELQLLSRRRLFSTTSASFAAAGFISSLALVDPSSESSTLSTTGLSLRPQSANAVGPVKIALLNPTYTAIPCPKDRPIPGEKAMKGMKGLCVTVNVDLEESPEKPLEKVGVYGFVTDRGTGESVLANNPDLSTDAGQFAMVESVKPSDKKITFEFIAAVPSETDVSQYDAGIAPLDFGSLRVISYPGGQQFGAISPCEMNEFSDECDAWEQENGPYKKADYMVKSNPRTKGY